jgi:hypothetical protein
LQDGVDIASCQASLYRSLDKVGITAEIAGDEDLASPCPSLV